MLHRVRYVIFLSHDCERCSIHLNHNTVNPKTHVILTQSISELFLGNHTSLFPFATETSLPRKLGLHSEPCFLSHSTQHLFIATTIWTPVQFGHIRQTAKSIHKNRHGEHQECHWPRQWRAAGPRACKRCYWCWHCWRAFRSGQCCW